MNSNPQVRFALCAVVTAAAAWTALFSLPVRAATLKPESMQLPGSDRRFAGIGAGAQAANSHCLTCHSAGMALTQPAMPRAAWLAEVNKMKNVFKAPIPEDQVAVIADYLASIRTGN
jgi:sulfite dehydrogenase (cytochrome) subunit B